MGNSDAKDVRQPLSRLMWGESGMSSQRYALGTAPSTGGTGVSRAIGCRFP